MDTATTSLNSILEGVRRGDYVVIPNVPIFDEHDEHDGRRYLRDAAGTVTANPNFGKVFRRFDRSKLSQIVERCNRRERETGDLAPIGPGHTIPGGPEIPETSQPPVWGYARNYRLAPYGPSNKLGIVVDLYARKEYADAVRRDFPRRSIELFYGDNLIDWVALLRRSPQRDLGLLSYSRDATEMVRKRFCPWDGKQVICSDSAATKSLAAIYSPDGRLRYAMPSEEDDSMPMPPNVDPAGGGAPPMPGGAPGGMPSPDELTPDEAKTAERFMKHYRKSDKLLQYMVGRYGAEAGLEPDMPGGAGGPPGDMGAMLSGTNGGPPGGMPPVSPPSGDDKDRMQRESQATRYARLEAENAALRQQSQEHALRYQRAECERLVTQLESEGFQLDRAAEVNVLIPLDPAGRGAHLDRIRRYYRQAPVGVTLVRTSETTPGDDYYGGMTRERFHKVDQYMRERPGMQWDEAIRTCPQ